MIHREADPASSNASVGTGEGSGASLSQSHQVIGQQRQDTEHQGWIFMKGGLSLFYSRVIARQRFPRQFSAMLKCVLLCRVVVVHAAANTHCKCVSCAGFQTSESGRL